MGGIGSGRHGGRPTAESSLKIDLAWMARRGWVKQGQRWHGTLAWTCGGEPSGSIGYVTILDEPGQERLELSYVRGPDHARENVQQTIRLTATTPRYGGKRFASRQSWRLGSAFNIWAPNQTYR
ncbi:hypothetical protein GTZ99_15280 [Novosphingobium sp. FSY-8]|uniref:Uncharacterized protein n=1 Tax=Novosphingobium ovatum TaxID=1908523 RepID=A0ABW9XHD8_9SPHN|nr:hypothetical protein [Novosphingobium ovatum]NBC37916.1 hypothetical protein [Novosphingobium ovatum]